ncbi:MAG: hypothetical protein HY078_06720 [Elusimicrobia bacterium]|nr:hypothetical protein [Elusimicrobiota bacterium]
MILGALCAILGAAGAAGAAPVPKEWAGKRIASITIRAYNVFEREEAKDPKPLYWIADRIHKTTRPWVIRQELLFKEGDPFNPDLIAETERNIRDLPYVRAASITAKMNKASEIDIVVRSYDAWSLSIIADFSRAGSQNKGKLGIADMNLMGQGLSMGLEHRRSGGAPGWAWSAKDAALWGRKVEYSLAARNEPGTRNYFAAVDRPFFASSVRTAWGVSGGYTDTSASSYLGDALQGSARKRQSEAEAHFGVSLATSTARVRRVKAGILHRNVDYTLSGPSDLPPVERLNFLSLAGDIQEYNFIKELQIQKFSHVEDINLGWSLQPEVHWSPPVGALRSQESPVMPRVNLSKGLYWDGGQLLLLRTGYNSTYVSGGQSAQVGTIGAAYYGRGLPHQTVAIRLGYDHSWRLDRASFLQLGEGNGLRGYRLDQFAGTRRAVMQVEDRFYIRNEILSLFDLGAAVFFDTGYAWPRGAGMQFSDLRSSVGFGIRVAPSRTASNSPWRIDVARALNDNGSPSRWSVSVLGGQSF